ncbi:MAG: hypothetical protein GXO26_09930 [Crenarchaeota archaeon]|nr:hypothetical protein [Thermoproteota archaeon]
MRKRKDRTRSIVIYIVKFLICYLVLVLIYVISAYLSYKYVLKVPTSILEKTTQYMEKALRMGALGIFLNNFVQATRMSLPIVGPLYAFVIMMNTGQFLGLYVYSKFGTGQLGTLVLVSSLLITLLYPYAIIELSAYAVALENSVSLTIRIFQGNVDKKLLFKVLLKYCVSIILLIIAAALEYATLMQIMSIRNSF